ncbi:MAG: rhomboid family intramembrane serine protease [Cyclobacteriaceae bacterium]|nr:MAG: rhomboid family intramembrane serine protease [Cyclobacteriaceae bacterium]
MFNDFKSAFQRHNNAHAQLIIINVVIFLVIGFISVIGVISNASAVPDFIYKQFIIPPTIAEYLTRPWTLITYMFAHSRYDIFHILFNMLALYWFGKLFVEYLGSDKLIAVYVLGGLAGGLLYLLMFNTIPFFAERSGFDGMVGASAALFAVMVATATLLSDYTFFLMFFGPIKIKYIALFFVVASYLGTTQTNAGGNIAHLGGALIGFIYTKQLKVGVNWGGWITITLDWFKDLFKPKRNVKVTYRKEEKRSGSKPSGPSKASQAEIDAILDKISDRGYESLTKEEKEKLFNASKK